MAALPQPKASLRDERTRQTRARLIEAAIALIVEQGWPKTTVEQIADRAGVAKGTFFVHFPTKEAIVLTLVEKQIARSLARREAAGDSPLARLAAATKELGSQAGADIELSRAVLIASLESRAIGAATDKVFWRLYQPMIADARLAIAKGEAVDIGAEELAGLFMTAYLGAALQCTSVPGIASIPSVLEPLVDATVKLVKKTKKQRRKR
jgi:AcrR family transcriptional regulator